MLYVGAAFLAGAPAIAGLAELTPDDAPPLLAGFFLVAIGLGFFSWLILVQLVVYLGVLYRLPRRRLLAILLSPLAVGILFVFAQGPIEAVIVVLAGIGYGASVWFPHGPLAWWQRRPRFVLVAAAAWLAVSIAVAVVQPLSAGIRTDVVATVEDGGGVARYRLVCEYDHAGRVRSEIRVHDAHPGGDRACDLIDFAARSLRDGLPYIQRLCPAGAPRAHFVGRVRGKSFDEEIVGGDCEETAFVDGETSVLVPARGR